MSEVCDLVLIHQPAASRTLLVLAGRQATVINRMKISKGFE